MRIRTYDGRVIIFNDSVELIRVDETIDKEARFSIYFQSLNDENKRVLAHQTNDEEIQWLVYCQAVTLMRSSNVALLDFEAMEINPELDRFQTDVLEYKEKPKTSRRKNLRRAY